jgi:hypothetical protein
MTAEVNGGENRLTGSKKEDLSLPEIFVFQIRGKKKAVESRREKEERVGGERGVKNGRLCSQLPM